MGGLAFDRARLRAEAGVHIRVFWVVSTVWKLVSVLAGVASRLWEWNKFGGAPRYTYVDLFGRYRCAMAASKVTVCAALRVHCRCVSEAPIFLDPQGSNGASLCAAFMWLPVTRICAANESGSSAALRSTPRGRLRSGSSESGQFCQESGSSPADAMLGSATGFGGASSPLPGLESTSSQASAARTVLRQRGVLRVNCVDCLDRTNVGHFMVGCYMLGYQVRCATARHADPL